MKVSSATGTALSIVIGVFSLSCLSTSEAQTPDIYPSKPVTVLVPFAPGGPSDLIARTVSSRLAAILGQPFVVTNRPGAGGTLGTTQAAHASADGYTLMVGNPGTHATAPLIVRGAAYDPIDDFSFIALLGTSTFVLLCNPKLPVKSAQDLIGYAKKNPGKITYGTAGTGSNVHFIFEYLKLRAGIDLLHVPYQGTGPMRTDLIAGNIDCTFDSSSKQYIDAGQMRALAVTSDKRDPIYPSVSTLEESGVSNFDIESWQAMMAPKNTPQAIIDKLNKAINIVLQDPETIKQFAALGFHVRGGTPDDLQKLAVRDRDLYRTIYDSAKMKVQ